ncbi:MAG: site-specific DNA-methyltransferase [Syntrophobacteraceae bacterium]
MTQKHIYGDQRWKEQESPTRERIARLKELFPEIFTEGAKIDLEKTRELFGDSVENGPERYSFSWAGKRDAIRLLQVPSAATLVPAREESINFDNTENIFIEGDNLEVLKLLQKSYFGRIKLIYIDPPYNTGKDFIYPDNFTDPLDYYLKLTGQKDSEGNLLTSNPETGGRFHSAWLSMMYPRLFFARQFLRDDGVILVSIDDHEVSNLRLMMNEIFGEENFIAQLVWEKGRKNDAKLFSVGHEYMLIYARSLSTLKELKTIWREPKPGAMEIWNEYLKLRRKHGKDDAEIEKELSEWFKSLPINHPSKKLSRYKHIDKWGPWRDRDISWPGGGGPDYDVPHPITKQSCKVPEDGWRFATPEKMEEQIKLGLVEFRKDHTEPPFRKAHLKPIPEELDENGEAPFDEDESEEQDSDVGLQVMPSCLYKQSQVAVKYLRKLMGAKIFDNPKDHEILGRLFRYITGEDEEAIVLDFFAGTSSAAEGVLSVNRQYGSNLKFLIVQLPEPTPEKSLARKKGFNTISEVGKERIRRVVKKMQKGQQTMRPEDLGMRVFKLTESNFHSWSGTRQSEPAEYLKQLDLFVDPLKKNWTEERIITEVGLKEGFGLNFRKDRVKAVSNNTVFRISDPDKGQSFLICLDKSIDMDSLKPLNLDQDKVLFVRDVALNDEMAANLALQCRLKTI